MKRGMVKISRCVCIVFMVLLCGLVTLQEVRAIDVCSFSQQGGGLDFTDISVEATELSSQNGELTVFGSFVAASETVNVQTYRIHADVRTSDGDRLSYTFPVDTSFSLVEGQRVDFTENILLNTDGDWDVYIEWVTDAGSFSSQECSFSVTSPEQGLTLQISNTTTYTGVPITISANLVLADDSFDDIEFRQDNLLLGRCDELPCQITHAFTRSGVYRIEAELTDGSDRYRARSDKITVYKASVPDVSVTFNPADPTIGLQTTVVARVDAPYPIQRVELFLNGALAQTCYGVSCSGTIVPQTRSLQYTLRIFPVVGSVQTFSRSVTVRNRIVHSQTHDEDTVQGNTSQENVEDNNNTDSGGVAQSTTSSTAALDDALYDSEVVATGFVVDKQTNGANQGTDATPASPAALTALLVVATLLVISLQWYMQPKKS